MSAGNYGKFCEVCLSEYGELNKEERREKMDNCRSCVVHTDRLREYFCGVMLQSLPDVFDASIGAKTAVFWADEMISWLE